MARRRLCTSSTGIVGRPAAGHSEARPGTRTPDGAVAAAPWQGWAPPTAAVVGKRAARARAAAPPPAPPLTLGPALVHARTRRPGEPGDRAGQLGRAARRGGAVVTARACRGGGGGGVARGEGGAPGEARLLRVSDEGGGGLQGVTVGAGGLVWL